MSLADTIQQAVAPIRKAAPGPLPRKPPTDVLARLDRGRKTMMRDASKRRLCMRFRRGDTYWFVDDKGILNVQSTVTSVNGGGKPPHRIRNRYDFLGPIIDAKVSAATQRVPSYEINPSTSDPQDIGAARLAEKVALFGYDQWRVRNATVKTVDLAIGGGGVGYALPYFDPNVGPYTQVDGEMVGRGEIKVLVLSGNQVYSEPGCDFEESRWYAIERARPIDEVRDIPGFVGGELTPDASTSDIPTDRSESDNLVMVTEYFERPCPRYPDGRCITVANGRPIVDYRLIDPAAEGPWGPYPLIDTDGAVLDEPILHRLVYRHDADTDSDLGLTWRLIDFERTAQDAYNKILELKNRGLNPQMLAPVGSLVDRPDDVPGAIRFYRPTSTNDKPEWQDPPDPSMLNALMSILERVVGDMRDVAFDTNIDVGPNVAARTAQQAVEQNDNKWQSFLGDLAEWHSRLMRHCLLLCARHYSEPRLLAIRGRFGPERIQDFLGSRLLGQVDVRVYADSLTSKSRAQIQQELAWIQANWPGYLSPETAIAALHGGTAEKLIESYELDLARVNSVVQAIVDGTVMELPARHEYTPPSVDPLTGAPVPGGMQEIPSYMPSESDSLPIWRHVFGDFLKTQEADRLAPAMQEVAQQVWAGIQYREAQQQQAAQAAMNAQAAQLGSENAARPQARGVPSQPGISAPAQLTP